MGIAMLLQVVQLQHCHQNASLHVLDQIMMLISVLLLSLHLPLCHLYDYCLTAMDWTKIRMRMKLLQVVQLQNWCQDVSLHASDQILMLMSVLFLSLHLPFCHLYDSPLMAMNWSKMWMKMMVLQVIQLQNWC